MGVSDEAGGVVGVDSGSGGLRTAKVVGETGPWVSVCLATGVVVMLARPRGTMQASSPARRQVSHEGMAVRLALGMRVMVGPAADKR